MDGIWQTLWSALVDPFRYPVDVTERIFIGYLGSALLLAVFVYTYLRRTRPETVPTSLLAYLFPKKIYLHKSSIADYQFYLIDRIVFALLLPAVLLYIRPISGIAESALSRAFGPVTEPWSEASLWVIALVTLTQLLLNDFLLYYIHYLFHKVPTLWEFHKVHHSAEVMTPLTAYRVHPFEVVFNMNVTALFSGAMLGVFSYLTGGGHPELTIFGINVVQFGFYIVGFNLRHSHIPLGYGPVISKVLVSPWMHQVHHSRETRHLDKNMGFIFSFWDAMFGTLYIPRRDEAAYELGLTTGEHVHFHSLAALYFRPFANLGRRWIKAFKPAKTA